MIVIFVMSIQTNQQKQDGTKKVSKCVYVFLRMQWKLNFIWTRYQICETRWCHLFNALLKQFFFCGFVNNAEQCAKKHKMISENFD